ncbi:hypothetical protein DF111_35625 [Burkholderia stagnalis]|nr:hypothetical protein DF111_35625 [Burkholderia stagnalis]RQY62503.1 hypothetical protein DF110_35475 [Burkholderia stagnalis]
MSFEPNATHFDFLCFLACQKVARRYEAFFERDRINKSAISHRVLLPDVSVKDTLHFVAPWVSSMNTDLVFATIALANFRKS